MVRPDPKRYGRVRVHSRNDRGDGQPNDGRDLDHKALVQQLLAQARKQGMSLVGPSGLLNQATKNAPGTAGSGTDREPRPQARPDFDRSQDAQWHPVQDPRATIQGQWRLRGPAGFEHGP